MKTGIKKAGTNHFSSKTRKRAAVLAMTGAAVAAGLVLAVPAGASPIAPTAAPAVSGAEHFQAMTTSATATTQGVIAWGVFTAAGVDHENSSNAPTSTDLFTFPGGSFKVTHTTKSMAGGFTKSCFASFTGKGTFKLSGGTGKYKGISGSGTFTFSDIGIAPKTKKGACNENANPIANQQVINANGTVKLP